MSSRTAVSVAASTLLGMSVAFAQPKPPPPPDPPLFHSIMVDSKGKTVGAFLFDPNNNSPGGQAPGSAAFVVRQINGVWVTLQVGDFNTGFQTVPPSEIAYWYQTTDCKGQAYFFVSQHPTAYMTGPAFGWVATIPPATMPSIYFAGSPAQVVVTKSYQCAGDIGCPVYGGGPGCQVYPGGGGPNNVGPVQIVPLNNLGLIPPFSIK
jgi:hypothetical protein